MPDNGYLLELRNISQVYSSGEQSFTAIKDFQLTMNDGEFLALLGPTGCGKSTLLDRKSVV